MPGRAAEAQMLLPHMLVVVLVEAIGVDTLLPVAADGCLVTWPQENTHMLAEQTLIQQAGCRSSFI